MKNALFLLIILISSFEVYSQDLVVTSNGDSINCKITKEKSDIIKFAFRREFDIIDTVIATQEIRTHQLNFYPRSDLPSTWNSGIDGFKPIQFSLDGGYSFRLARLAENIPDELIDYYQDLSRGFNFGAGIQYNISNTLGFGIKYHTFLSSNSIDDVDFKDPFGGNHFGFLSDKLTLSTYSLSFSLKTPYDSFYTNYLIGYTSYIDKIHVIGDFYKVTGNTVTLGFESGYDLEIFPNFYLGFQSTLLTGAIKKFNIENGGSSQTIELDKDKYENLFRIDFSIGIRYKL